MRPTSVEELTANAASLSETLPDEFRDFVDTAAVSARPARPKGTAIFTDDHAPVEWVVHRIIYDYLVGG
jgi:hypothetical protein